MNGTPISHEVVLGCQVAKAWVTLVLRKHMAFGPMAAWWLVQRVPLHQRTRRLNTGTTISEVVPTDPNHQDFYAHGQVYLNMLKSILVDCGVWQGQMTAGPRMAPASEAQMEGAVDTVLQGENLALLTSGFERISLNPGDAACQMKMRAGTIPMFTRSQVLGRLRFQVSTDPAVFMKLNALGLEGHGPGFAESWWVAYDGWSYVLMQRSADGMSWFKCGINRNNDYPGDPDQGMPDSGMA